MCVCVYVCMCVCVYFVYVCMCVFSRHAKKIFRGLESLNHFSTEKKKVILQYRVQSRDGCAQNVHFPIGVGMNPAGVVILTTDMS